MNTTPVYGWYYRSSEDRTPSWTAARYLYQFLTTNKGPGPYGTEQALERAEPGDIIQLSFDGTSWSHSLPVVGFQPDGQPLVAAHSFNALDRPLGSYVYQLARLIHLEGVQAASAVTAGGG